MKPTIQNPKIEKQLEPLQTSEQGKLKGGFSVFSANKSITASVAASVNVDVSGWACACGCPIATE